MVVKARVAPSGAFGLPMSYDLVCRSIVFLDDALRVSGWSRRVVGGERTREAGGVCAWDTRAEESDRDCGEEVL